MNPAPFAEAQVLAALKAVKYPGFSRDIVSFGLVKGLALDGGKVTLHLALATADKAVLDGAIMLARTVVQLAESSDQRDRVLAAQSERRR